VCSYMLFVEFRSTKRGPGAGLEGRSPDNLTTSEKEPVKCTKVCEGIAKVVQCPRSVARNQRHIRWISQYIRNRTWMRSRRSDLKTCEVLIASNTCLAFVVSLTVVRDCGVLIHWIGKIAMLGQFIKDILGLAQWVGPLLLTVYNCHFYS
jgi:hypothetical protein